MKKIIVSIGVSALAITASLVYAQGFANVTYPIAELGRCKDQEACRVYCESKENMSACIDFASAKGMISKDEVALARKAAEKIRAGQTPGGCHDRESCSNFCQNNASSLKSCIAFAKEVGVSGDDIAEAERVSAALEKGAQLPGGCQGKMACEAYCKNTEHVDECLSFAEAAGMIPASELAEAKKIAKYIKSGAMPGNCKSKGECEAYCKNDAHFEECISFADKAGLISKEEADMARKTGGKGPGDCRSNTECEVYCNTPEHATECANFAVEKGLVSEQNAENIKGGVAKMRQALDSMPPEARSQVESCLNNVFGGKLPEVLSGAQMITRAQGDKIRPCFSGIGEMMKRKAMEQGGRGFPDGGTGRVDMKNVDTEKMIQSAPKEIQDQLRARMEEAQKTGMMNQVPSAPGGVPAGMGIPQPPTGVQGAPCNSPEECRAMFGGSADAPPPGIPAGYPTGMPR